MPQGRPGGHPTWWREAGSGPRRALLLHCSLAHSGAFKGLMGELGDLATMTAIDLPGHGRSADWDEGEPLQHLVVRIAEAFLPEEGAGKIDLIGHSFGASALLRVAYLNRTRVRSLTLIEPPYYDALKAEAHPALSEQLAQDAGFAEALRRGDRAGAAEVFTDLWGGPGGWAAMPEVTRIYATERIHLIEGAGQTLNADYAGVLRPGGLEELHLPVALIRGAASPVAVAPILDHFARRLPDAALTVVEGAGHMLPITHPAPVAGAIRALFSRS